MTPFFFELRLDQSNRPGVLSNHLKAVIDFLNYFCYNNIIKRKEIKTMKEYKDMADNEIREIIKKLSEELEERRYSKKCQWLKKFENILNEYTEITGENYIYYGDDDSIMDIAFPDLIKIFEEGLGV